MCAQSFTVCVMKSTKLFVRIEEGEKAAMVKAARGHKSLSAFLLSSVRKANKYRRLIEQAEKLAAAGIKISAMEVKT